MVDRLLRDMIDRVLSPAYGRVGSVNPSPGVYGADLDSWRDRDLTGMGDNPLQGVTMPKPVAIAMPPLQSSVIPGALSSFAMPNVLDRLSASGGAAYQAPMTATGPSPLARNLFAPKPTATTATTTTTTPTTGTGGTADGASGVAAVGPSPGGVKPTVMRWLPQAQAAAEKYDIPVELILATISNESSGDPNATSPYNPGQGTAKGLMQLLDLHFAPGEDHYDPATNIDKGAKYLAANYHQYGKDPQKAFAAYFGGSAAIDAAGNIQRGLSDGYITIGRYLDERFTPALAAYSNYLQGGGETGSAPAARPLPATPQAAQGLQAAAIAEATKHIGTPYLLAGQANNPKAGAFDCSGLVQWSYGQAGKALPRVAQDQYNQTARIAAEDARPGDLVFFTGTYNAGTPVTHVGIYLGGNQMLQAGSGGVGYADLSTPYWRDKLYGWGRVV